MSCHPADGRLQAGDTMATIDLGLGVLTIGAPRCGQGGRAEPPVVARPGADCISNPIAWVGSPISLANRLRTSDHLFRSDAARDQALADLSALRRRVATQLLAEEGDWASMANGGEMACDLRACSEVPSTWTCSKS